MKIFLATIFTLAFGLSVFGQTQQVFEYGKPTELKGLKKLYIMPTADDAVRKKLTDEIQNSKAGIKVVEDPKDAEMVMKFRPDNNQSLIAIKGKKPESPRILMELKSPQDYKPEEIPDEKFVSAFIKQYKLVNGKSNKNDMQDLPIQTTIPGQGNP